MPTYSFLLLDRPACLASPVTHSVRGRFVPAAFVMLALWALPGAVAAAPPPPAAAATPPPSLEEMATSLAELRAEVELLDARLRTERAQGLTALRGLESRKSELSALLDTEQVKTASLEGRVAAAESTLSARKGATEALVTAVRDAIAAVEASIRGALPFRATDRLAALAALRGELAAGRASPESAATRLWRFLEDELTLVGQVERAEVPLTLERGEAERLLPVVRVGMLTMFTQLGGGVFGRLVPDGGGWRHETIADPLATEEVRRLFEALERQVREGPYTLPLPLSAATPAAEGSGS